MTKMSTNTCGSPHSLRISRSATSFAAGELSRDSNGANANGGNKAAISFLYEDRARVTSAPNAARANAGSAADALRAAGLRRADDEEERNKLDAEAEVDVVVAAAGDAETSSSPARNSAAHRGPRTWSRNVTNHADADGPSRS